MGQPPSQPILTEPPPIGTIFLTLKELNGNARVKVQSSEYNFEKQYQVTSSSQNIPFYKGRNFLYVNSEFMFTSTKRFRMGAERWCIYYQK